MRFIRRPEVDDSSVVDLLARRSKAAAAVVVRRAADDLKARYAHYLEVSGNPWAVTEAVWSEDFADGMNALYKRPPVALQFIGEIRSGVSGACPVCGGSGTGTVDHYLPKRRYPDFSFFSANLVPACYRCNVARGDLVSGDAPQQRMLHPYFEASADERLVTMHIDPPYESPVFGLRVLNVENPNYDVIAWHVNNVVLPAGVLARFRELWTAVSSKPLLHLGRVADPFAISVSLRDARDRAESIDSSKNGWDSTFYDGLMRDQDVVTYLARKVSIGLNLVMR